MDALVRYLNELSKAAPKTPLVYYHYVDKTGVDVSIFDLIKVKLKHFFKEKRVFFPELHRKSSNFCRSEIYWVGSWYRC